MAQNVLAQVSKIGVCTDRTLQPKLGNVRPQCWSDIDLTGQCPIRTRTQIGHGLFQAVFPSIFWGFFGTSMGGLFNIIYGP